MKFVRFLNNQIALILGLFFALGLGIWYYFSWVEVLNYFKDFVTPLFIGIFTIYLLISDKGVREWRKQHQVSKLSHEQNEDLLKRGVPAAINKTREAETAVHEADKSVSYFENGRRDATAIIAYFTLASILLSVVAYLLGLAGIS